jgi:hypothetical protein
LVTPEGETQCSLARLFNEGRLDCGGRLYGPWQSLKEAERLRLNIDGCPVCEIDLVGSFLFLGLTLSGAPMMDEDPYARIAFVRNDPTKRGLAKKLTLAVISVGEKLRKFPKGVRKEFDLQHGDNLDQYQNDILEVYPILEHLGVHGLELMVSAASTTSCRS